MVRKELASVLVILVILTSVLDSSLIVWPSEGKLPTGSLYNEITGSSDTQPLSNDNVGSGKLSGLGFWWAATSGKRPFSNQNDPLLGWSTNDTNWWSEIAYVKGNITRLIVGVDSWKDPSFTQVAKLATRYGGIISDRIRIGQQVRAIVIELPINFAKTFAINAYSLWSVRYVEPNVKIQAEYTPNDANWTLQWGPQRIQADWAWNTTTGDSKILVAVVDTGIDYTHPDIAPNYVAGGYDWVNNDGDPMDDHGHGTHCAGIIAAVTNNSIGISGIAQVHVMTEKVLSSGGWGYWDWVAKGIINATDCGAKIISMSLGGYYDSELVHDAIKYADGAGVLVVAAAGNSATNQKSYPAGYPEVLAVAATDRNDTPASFSNWGDWIDLTAPGVDIYSTVLHGYQSMSGTSMACPHVSGVAALAWSRYQIKSKDWIRMWLRYTADDLGVPGFDVYYGYGRVNARAAVEQPIPNHEIVLVNSEIPRYDEPGHTQYINATVLNFGASDENNVEIRLLVNSSLARTEDISYLASSTSTRVSFSWTPAILGKYNITVFAVPLPGENITSNNVRSGWISVQYPLVNPIPGQWATYGVTYVSTSGSQQYSTMKLTYDRYVEPYVIYVTETLSQFGYVSTSGMSVNTMNRRVESNPYQSYWFFGLIETNITLGSTVNLMYGNATVDGSKYILYGIYPIDCWDLYYDAGYGGLYHFYYDKATGLWIAADLVGKGYRYEYRLTSTNIPLIPSYEHELGVRLDAPAYVKRGDSILLNATVFNIGSSTENNVVLSLIVGDGGEKQVTIPTLPDGTSYTMSYLWTPTMEAKYVCAASVQPVANETYLGNNAAVQSVTVSHPVIYPVQGQYANYRLITDSALIIIPVNPSASSSVQGSTWNFTYLCYISSYQVNVTIVTRSSDTGLVHSRWIIVNTFTRLVEEDSDLYWIGSSFIGWIGTNIALGDTVKIWLYNYTVVGNKVVCAGGRFIDCWEIQMILPYSETWLFDKASGLLVDDFEPNYGYTTHLSLLNTSVPLGFTFNHEIITTVETMGIPVVGRKVILNATVYNTGISDEANIHLQLMINGTLVSQVNIKNLQSNGFYSLNYAWVPTKVGYYNISAYAHPVPGEEYVTNNEASISLEIRCALYKRTYLAHQWVGDESPQGLHFDDASFVYNLPFNFPFYGQTYDWIYYSTKGLITFMKPSYGLKNSISELAAMVAIAPAWCDWSTSNTYQSYDISVSANGSEIRIMWYVSLIGNQSVTATFEAILRADGKIQFNYGSSNGPVSATIGISDGAGCIVAEDTVNLNYIRSIVFIPDRVPPCTITDLTASFSNEDAITLTWTAPGDDGRNGNATGYMVKFSTTGPINDSNWESATTYTQSWAPLPPNSTESHEVSGLSPSTRYWFAVKACDGVSNFGEVSNSPSGVTGVSAPVAFAVTVISFAVLLVVAVVAVIMDTRVRRAEARRRALTLRRRRISIRRRNRYHPEV